MKKITRTTFKTLLTKGFGIKNKPLYIKNKSNFDGMTDCVMPTDDNGWREIEVKEGTENMTGAERIKTHDNHLGYKGVWLTGSRDWYTAFNDGEFTGIEVSNCCGNFFVGHKI